MPRFDVTLTSVYQQVSAVENVMSVKSGIGKRLTYNDVNGAVGETDTLTTTRTQIFQNEVKPTWAKGEGLVVTIDEAG